MGAAVTEEEDYTVRRSGVEGEQQTTLDYIEQNENKITGGNG